MSAPHEAAAAAGVDRVLAGGRRAAKDLSTWQARYALRGYQLRALDDGRFLVVAWNLSRELAEHELERFAAAIGA